MLPAASILAMAGLLPPGPLRWFFRLCQAATKSNLRTPRSLKWRLGPGESVFGTEAEGRGGAKGCEGTGAVVAGGLGRAGTGLGASVASFCSSASSLASCWFSSRSREASGSAFFSKRGMTEGLHGSAMEDKHQHPHQQDRNR